MIKRTNKAKCNIVLILTVVLSLVSSTSVFAAYKENTVTTLPTGTTDVSAKYYWVKSSAQNLLVSNDPETIGTGNALGGNGIFCKDTGINRNGKFRVFWSHKNTTGNTKYIGMAIYNKTGSTIKVHYGKEAFEVSTATNNGYQAGGDLVEHWLKSSDTSATVAPTVTNGNYAYRSFQVPTGQWGMGLSDIQIKDLNGNLVTGGITVKIFSSPTADPKTVLDNDQLFARYNTSTNPESIRRARYTYATKTLANMFFSGTEDYYFRGAVKDQLTFLSIKNMTIPSHPLYTPLPTNDLDVGGIDESDGNLPAINQGSYGMDLNISVKPTSNVAYILTPSQIMDAGIPHVVVVKVTKNGAVYYVRQTLSNKNSSVVLATGTSGDVIRFVTMLAPNDGAPYKIAVVPN